MGVRVPVAALAVSLLAGWLCPAAAESQAAAPGVEQGSSAAQPKTKQETPEAAARRERRKILTHVNDLGARLKALPDRHAKVYHLIEFADELCKHDKAAAAGLFGDARDTLSRWQKTPDAKAFGDSVVSLRHYHLLRAAWRCDAKLPALLDPAGVLSRELQRAEALLKQALHAGDAETKLELARQALAAGGVEFWERPPKRMGVTFDGPIMWLLPLLGGRNGTMADQLFLQAVAALRSAPLADPRNIVYLGDPLFGGGYASYDEIMVPRWTADRAAKYPQLAAAYLDAAADQLLRQIGVAGDKTQALIVSRLLLPRVKKYAPERATELEALIEALRPAAKSFRDWQENPASPSPHETGKGGETRELEIEGMADEKARGPSYLRLAVDLARDGKYDRAREIAAKIEVVEARRTLVGYIGVQEAGRALDRGGFDTAEGIVERIAAADGRAVLLIALAAARAKSDPVLGFDTALAALRETDVIADGRRGYFKLAVAQVLAQVARKVAFEVLQQAINGMNEAYSAWLAGSERAPRGFDVFIEFGPREEMGKGHYGYFSGSYNPSKFLEGVGNLGQAIERFAALDLDQTEGVCLTLADPDEQAQAIQALAAVWLRELPPAPVAE